MNTVAVTGSFDNLRSAHVRFLEEAAKFGKVHVALWSDEAVTRLEGKPAQFPERERAYLLQSLRFVERVSLAQQVRNPDDPPDLGIRKPDLWVVDKIADSPAKRERSKQLGIEYRIVAVEESRGFPPPPSLQREAQGARKKVLVTGCYDWFHSGHVRFFEEASALGDLYVVVGHDANIRLLKGEGHPLLPEAERVYMVGAVRFVHHAAISTGHGWLDAEPEIERFKPDVYLVNEDGDKPEKKHFCVERRIEYIVLKRIPKEGLPKRESTALRGF
jgi:cytidyltransferase-like protein